MKDHKSKLKPEKIIKKKKSKKPVGSVGQESPVGPVNPKSPVDPANTVGYTKTHLGAYQFKKKYHDEPLDLVQTTQWVGWCPIDTCKVCLEGPFDYTYEALFEWGDTRNFEYISEVCPSCMNYIYKNYIRNNEKEKYY
jgi:hypothetical protein